MQLDRRLVYPNQLSEYLTVFGSTKSIRRPEWYAHMLMSRSSR